MQNGHLKPCFCQKKPALSPLWTHSSYLTVPMYTCCHSVHYNSINKRTCWWHMKRKKMSTKEIGAQAIPSTADLQCPSLKFTDNCSNAVWVAPLWERPPFSICPKSCPSLTPLLNNSSSTKTPTVKVTFLLTLLSFHNVDYSVLLKLTYVSPSTNQEAPKLNVAELNTSQLVACSWHLACCFAKDSRYRFWLETKKQFWK